MKRPRTDDYAFTLALALIALLPRLFVAIAWAKEPVWDGHYYHFGAERIALGLGYSEDVMIGGVPVWKPWTHYPVGYSALLGLVYGIFGSGLAVAPVVNAVIGTLLVVVVHRVARYYLSSLRARLAAGLAALHPGLIVYSAVVMTELLAALLLLTAGLCALRWRGKWQGVALSGFVLGIATLVRPSSLLAAPLIALTQPRPLWNAALRAALVVCTALLVVSPWTIRNCIRMDGCALVSTNGGWNLAIGAITPTGRFHTLRGKDGCPVVTGQVQQDDCWADVGKRIILADPWRWIGKMPKKLSQTYDHESFAIEYLHEADPSAWPEARRTAARELLTFLHLTLLSAAAFGVAGNPLSWRTRSKEFTAQVGVLFALCGLIFYGIAEPNHPFFWLAVVIPPIAIAMLPGRPTQGPAGRYSIGLLAATSLTHAVFFGEDRYHLVVTPVLCMLAAAALRGPGARAANAELRRSACAPS